MSTATAAPVETSASETPAKDLGYKTFTAVKYRFERDEYFAHIYYPGGRHLMHIEAFLRALMRDVGWGFFYGTVNFDSVLGTINHYGTVDLFVGLLNEGYRANNRHYVETFNSRDLKKVFEEMLDDSLEIIRDTASLDDDEMDEDDQIDQTISVAFIWHYFNSLPEDKGRIDGDVVLVEDEDGSGVSVLAAEDVIGAADE